MFNLNLTTSKTKEFCETSSIFEVDSIKNEAILGDFLPKWKVEWRADGLLPMHLAIFPFHLSKVARLPRKSEARSYEVLRLSRKTCFPMFLKLLQNPHVLLTFRMVQNPLSLPRKTTSQLQKVLRDRQFFTLLNSKCASRHNAVHFFPTSQFLKCGVFCVHFDLEMCLAPQLRTLFEHLNS